MASIYDPIWEKLKELPIKEAETVGVKITANRLLHPRIIKAVTKRKLLDIGFKVQIHPMWTVLHPNSAGAIIHFTLEYKAPEKLITAADL